MKAREKESLGEVLARLAEMRVYAAKLGARIASIRPPNNGRRLIEIGAAAGCLTIAFRDLGYDCVGIEPDSDALKAARNVADTLGERCLIQSGRGENIPFPDESFDVVITNSVLEHVEDIDACLREISRVLKPGGLLWFETASCMCPFQHEIRHFPLFGWYPDPLKKKIMWWAARRKPELVGHTATPAIHWFSDAIARARLTKAGLDLVADRWSLRRDDEGGAVYLVALKLIRSSPIIRRVANMAIPECSYAAVKRVGK